MTIDICHQCLDYSTGFRETYSVLSSEPSGCAGYCAWCTNSASADNLMTVLALAHNKPVAREERRRPGGAAPADSFPEPSPGNHADATLWADGPLF